MRTLLVTLGIVLGLYLVAVVTLIRKPGRFRAKLPELLVPGVGMTVGVLLLRVLPAW